MASTQQWLLGAGRRLPWRRRMMSTSTTTTRTPPPFAYLPPSPSSSARSKPFFVSTPIFYVNASPHIGHLHSALVADALARYNEWRHQGWSPAYSSSPASPSQPPTQPLLSTGTDEHGLKIQKVAQDAGRDEVSLCSDISQRFRDLANAANLSKHVFIRTTEARHATAVRDIWQRLFDGGYIYKGEHSGWYAVSDEAFYTDQQVEERTDAKTGIKHMYAIETGQRVEWSSEENYKFRLSLFRDALIAYHTSPQHPTNQPPLQPPNQHAALLAELQAGQLADLSVSRPRSRLHWGIPVPGDDQHTIYVWIDALVNYLTVTGFPWSGQNEENTSAWPADVHVVGKDIVRFHAIYWPAMLMAAGLPLPRHIVAHAHWTMDKAKMSKSRGNVVDPFVALRQFRPAPSPATSSSSLSSESYDDDETDKTAIDILRWYLLRIGGNLASDSDYSEALLWEHHRKYLQGQLGNLASRAVAPKVLGRLLDEAATKDEHGKVDREVQIPRPIPSPTHQDADLAQTLANLAPTFDSHMERFELSKALNAIHDTIAQTNELLSRLEPWAPATDLNDVRRAVYYAAESVRLAGVLLGATAMPASGRRMLDVVLRLRWGQEGTRWQDVSGGNDGHHQDQQQQDVHTPAVATTRRSALSDRVRLWVRTDGSKIAPLFPALPKPAPMSKTKTAPRSSPRG